MSSLRHPNDGHPRIQSGILFILCSRKTRLIPPSRSRFTQLSRAAGVKGGRRPALAPCP
jgi:hypothetical protein